MQKQFEKHCISTQVFFRCILLGDDKLLCMCYDKMHISLHNLQTLIFRCKILKDNPFVYHTFHSYERFYKWKRCHQSLERITACEESNMISYLL